MNANTEIDLETLEAAIAADIRAQFPDLKTVEFYREDRTELPVPAVLLELTEWEYDEERDPGTEQLAVLAHFEAEVIIGFRKVHQRLAKAEIRRLVGALGAFMYNRRWNKPGAGLNGDGDPIKLPTGPVQIVGAYPDEFQGMDTGKRGDTLDRYEVWRLAWQQKVHLGKSVWNSAGFTPTALYSRETIQPFPPGPVELYEEGVQNE